MTAQDIHTRDLDNVVEIYVRLRYRFAHRRSGDSSCASGGKATNQPEKACHALLIKERKEEENSRGRKHCHCFSDGGFLMGINK